MTRRAALAHLEHGLSLMLTGVRELMEDQDPEEWIAQDLSPLGRRRHCELARAGAFPSAHKAGGKWLVRRKDLDAFIESKPVAERGAVANDAAEEAAILDYKAPPKRGRRAG